MKLYARQRISCRFGSMDSKKPLAVATAFALILSPLAIIALGEFLGGLSAVPFDFISSILTFDGIMIAVVTLSVPQLDMYLKSPQQKRTGIGLLWFISVIFVLSAVIALYSMTRAIQSPTLGLAIPVSKSDLNPVTEALDLTIMGVILWLANTGLVMFAHRKDSVP